MCVLKVENDSTLYVLCIFSQVKALFAKGKNHVIIKNIACKGETCMKKISLIHGANLNLTGTREPGIYGRNNLESINDEFVKKCEQCGFAFEIFQSNSEGDIIDRIHAAIDNCDGIIINAGAYTHYSYAIRDAISATRLPCIEVNLSNIHAREDFRNNSVIAPVCAGVITGFGKNSYMLAVDAMKGILE